MKNFKLVFCLAMAWQFLIPTFVFSNKNPIPKINEMLKATILINPYDDGNNEDLHHVSIILSNAGNQPIERVEINSQVNLFSGSASSVVLNTKFSGDPNGNNSLDPDEIWLYSSTEHFNTERINNYRVAIAAHGTFNGHSLIAGDATQLLKTPFNMDIEFDQDCYQVGDKATVSLITRLLIDEDAAKNPGTVTIIVSGVPITIQLPATHWEARDLMITVSGLNDDLPFDPFDPPAGVELTNFCDQGFLDSGRNTNNVLDECEPIETVRFPCENFGENDIECEYPDWVFCYCFDIDEGMDELVASDDFSIWTAEESPAGSGIFGLFQDITDNIESGGSDTESICIEEILILHDICADALELIPNDFFECEATVMTNIGAQDEGVPCPDCHSPCNEPINDVWAKFIAPANSDQGDFWFKILAGPADRKFQVMDACDGTIVSCDEDLGGGVLVPGQMYYIRMWSESDIESNFTICLNWYYLVPVELKYYTAEKSDRNSKLSWATLSEINNSHFAIERSIDGINFEQIGSVEGNGTTTSEKVYSFYDKDPFAGKNYYRLIQHDYDGTKEDLGTRTLDFSYVAGTGSVKVYPNPTADFLYLETPNQNIKIEVVITAMDGKHIFSKSLNSNEQLDLRDLSEGQYLIRIYDDHRYEIGQEKITIVR